jgi:hypothetical protein
MKIQKIWLKKLTANQIFVHIVQTTLFEWQYESYGMSWKKNVTLTSQSWVWIVLEPSKFTSLSRRATWRCDRVDCLQSDDVFPNVRYRRWYRRLGVELRCTMKRCRRPNSFVNQTADFNGFFRVSWIFECSVLSSRGVNVFCEYTMPLSKWQSFNWLDYEDMTCDVVNVRKAS